MDFQWTDTQVALYDEAVAFGRDALNASKVRDGVPMTEIWRTLADFGATGLIIPETWGGAGLSALSTARVLEGLGYGAGTTGHLFGLCAHLFGVAAPLIQFGTDAQKSRWLPGLAGGDCVGALAATEPGAGSCADDIRCTAEEKDGAYILNGEKIFVTNAPYAHLFLITASTDRDRGSAGLSSFLVESKNEGVSIQPSPKKMGLYPSEMASIWLDACAVREDQRLHAVGRGAESFGEAMTWERALILAPRIGALRHHLEACVEHARTRKQGGRRIGHHQGVSHRIAKMAVKITAAQTFLYRAAWSLDAQQDASRYASMAKHFISEVAVEAHLDSIRIFGGSGYLQEIGVEAELRDAVGGLIHSGTSEIQLNIIASHLGL